jgi:tetratricopeptide (TPR) repeat protein
LQEYALAKEYLTLCKQYQPARVTCNFHFFLSLKGIAYVFIALLQSLGDVDSAIEELSYAYLKDTTNNQDILCIRAALYHHLGKMYESFVDSSAVLEINSKNILALIIKGDALKYDVHYVSNTTPLKTKRNEELIYYQQALELDKENSSNFIGKGFQGSDVVTMKLSLRNGEKTRASTLWWQHLNKMFEIYSVDVPKYYSLRNQNM